MIVYYLTLEVRDAPHPLTKQAIKFIHAIYMRIRDTQTCAKDYG